MEVLVFVAPLQGGTFQMLLRRRSTLKLIVARLSGRVVGVRRVSPRYMRGLARTIALNSSKSIVPLSSSSISFTITSISCVRNARAVRR